MRRWNAVWMLAGCLAVRAEDGPRKAAPSYSVSSVVSSVTYTAALAPFTPVTIFGSDLSLSTAQWNPGEARLPTELAGVTVTVSGLRVPLFYVSERQINILLPGVLEEGDAPLRVIRLGVAGPEVILHIAAVAPALFRTGSDLAVATHADGSLITRDAAARPGELIVLYAAGLGLTRSELPVDGVPAVASEILRLRDFRVLLDGVAVDSSRVLYAGITPKSAGLYQVNLLLPENAGTDPEVRLAIGEQASTSGIRLPVR
jgi:uncharacterized protein (TIGR03437 family)